MLSKYSKMTAAERAASFDPMLNNYFKAAAAERAAAFATEYAVVTADVFNATWDLYKNRTQLVQHGEVEECSTGSITNKPLCNVCSHAINKTLQTRGKKSTLEAQRTRTGIWNFRTTASKKNGNGSMSLRAFMIPRLMARRTCTLQDQDIQSLLTVWTRWRAVVTMIRTI